ncbi:MAG: serine/threonine-protein phosphatase [Betaproteobacteria bacterium]|nr:serine/threonine-protein phosphatase [Betaproteobacteria bacterium]
MSMNYAIYQASRTGGRPQNEDRVAYAYTPESVVMALCDGMGGHSLGEIASQLTVQVVVDLFQTRAQPTLPDLPAFLLDAIYAAHDAVNEYALRKRMADPPRTTCVVCVVQGDEACWAHVGDSRLYHFNRHGMVSRTRDHSAVQQMFERGHISEADMSIHPDRNKLYNSIGGYMLPDIELSQTIKLREQDVLLLCTDGVWPELTPQEMFSTLRAYPLERAVKHIMDHAEFRAGPGCDNLSMVALRYGNEHFDTDQLVAGDGLGLDGFTTQIRNLSDKSAPPPPSDDELDQALAEIQAKLDKIKTKPKLKP